MEVFLEKLSNKQNLTFEESKEAFEILMNGKASDEEIYSFLTLLSNKGEVSDEIADKYFSSRGYESKISAWASEQSKVLGNRSDLLERIAGFKKTYSEKKNVPRPENWSGWILQPIMIEFWLKGSHRIHERLRYHKESNNWIKKLLNP